jgi:hypothetical protein
MFGGGLTAEAAVATAYGHRDDTNLPTYYIYTPDPSAYPYHNGQEFFSMTPAAEPSTVLLLMLTLMSVGGWVLKQRFSSSSSPSQR